MNILIACERSGIVRDAFIKKGHNAISCDIKYSDAPGPHYHGDVRGILELDWDMMIAHPVCTRLANSGVRWLTKPPKGLNLKDMWNELDEAANFYNLLRNADIKKKVIENPVMHCHARKLIKPNKRQVVQPWWFGEEAFKATGLEIFNLPDLVPTNKLTPPKLGTEEHKKWSWIHRMTPCKDRSFLRSKTFQGIADAMADQWG